MPGLLSHVRRTHERLLHPLRRRKALEALRRRTRPQRLLVVCYGNICRSPVAAALLRRELTPLGIEVQSAGLIGFNRPAPAEAVNAAQRCGVDLSSHYSRLVTVDSLRTADLIVVMEPSQRRHICERFGLPPSNVMVLGDFDPAGVNTRAIRDPVDQHGDVFDQVYERIARCVRELVNGLGSAGTLPTAASVASGP